MPVWGKSFFWTPIFYGFHGQFKMTVSDNSVLCCGFGMLKVPGTQSESVYTEVGSRATI